MAINHSREALFDRINHRVDAMIEAGLEQEAARVYPLRHLNSLNTVGYKELFAMMDGTMPRETAIPRIAKNTRVYAKSNCSGSPKTRRSYSSTPPARFCLRQWLR